MGRSWVYAASAAAVTLGAVTGPSVYERRQRKQQQRSAELQEKIIKASALIQRHMVTNGIPGVCVGVTVDGERVFSRGFGYANVENGTLCTEDTVMRIASISKPITATIAALLVQEGKLDLGKPIQNYLPDYPKKKFNGKEVEITTRQLLCHMSGIRHYEKKNGKKDLEDPANNNTHVEEFLSNVNYASVTDALKMFQDDELVAEPGTEFNYTTHGLTVVSAVLEKTSGTSFPRLVDQLCARLELRNTHLDMNNKIIPHRASYYVRKNRVLENCQEVNNSYKWAGGGLLSNVGDLLKLANSYLSSHHAIEGSLLKPDVLADFWKGEINSGRDSTLAALGWMRIDGLEGYKRDSPTLWYHTGAAVGASSVLLIRPRSQDSASNQPAGICVVMLCNLQDTSLLSLARDIEAIFHQ